MDQFRAYITLLATIPEATLNRINYVFGSYKKVTLNILEGILNNQELFELLSIWVKSICIDFDKLAHLKSDKIIIYVKQLDLYGLVSPSDYKYFCSNLTKSGINPKVYQLMLTTEKQKVVLLCDNSVKSIVRSKMTQVLGQLIHVSEDDNRCEITLQDIFVDNYNEVREIYMDIISKLTPNMSNIGEYLTMMVPVMGPNHYLKYDISESVPMIGKNMKQYKDIIEQIMKHPGKNNIIVIGNSNVVNTGNMTSKNVAHQITRNWIAKNPPNNTVKSEYYNAYINSEGSEDITACKFGKIMSEMGYKGGYSGKTRTWK